MAAPAKVVQAVTPWLLRFASTDGVQDFVCLLLEETALRAEASE